MKILIDHHQDYDDSFINGAYCVPDDFDYPKFQKDFYDSLKLEKPGWFTKYGGINRTYAQKVGQDFKNALLRHPMVEPVKWEEI